MLPIRLEPSLLGPEESPPEHACATTALYGQDLALLNYLLQDLRALVRQAAHGTIELRPHQSLVWNVHGLRRRTVICNPAALQLTEEVKMVGFFGDRRSTKEADEVDSAELDVIGQFRDFPGILSYSSIELVDNQWANMVLHLAGSDRDDWRHSDVHIVAAEQLAPRVYHSVRIHNGCVPYGPMGSSSPVIESTKYFDYDCDPMWHAMRLLPGGATATIDTADAASE